MKAKVFLFSLISAILIQGTAFGNQTPLTLTEKVINYWDCESGTLLIRLNIDNETPKKDLIKALQAMGEYEDLFVTPTYPQEKEVSYLVSGSCGYGYREHDDQYCDTPNGWTELQWRIKPIRGTETTCAPYGDEEEEEGDGGVTGSNDDDGEGQ
jgi:hypothetical protein